MFSKKNSRDYPAHSELSYKTKLKSYLWMWRVKYPKDLCLEETESSTKEESQKEN